tara:strand:- start:871 stop:1311 length:441 start_codon:yes stop_codon:yes gene_type:complete
MRRTVYLLVLTLLVALLPMRAQAEQFKTFDHYEVHYSAFNSTFLTPEVAQTYSIQRSKVRGLLNIAVLDARTKNVPVTALVTGTITNLVGQTQALVFNQVREGEAVYYIGEFRFTNDEILNFEVEVQPDPNNPAYLLTFKQHFYVD